MNLIIKDTTFRDGIQGEGVESNNINDSLKAIKAINSLGAHYIEAGFPSASLGAKKRIKAACQLNLQGKICAFGRSHPADIKTIIEMRKNSGLPVAVIVGKTRLQDAKTIKKTPLENLEIISQSIDALVKNDIEVIFDAEHFFQAVFEDDKEYALQVLKTARKAGACWIVLCDTNGKMTPELIKKAIDLASTVIPKNQIGIHTHNDRGRALANAEAACAAGAVLVEGTIGGFGERTGNLDLCAFLPNAVLDYQADSISLEQLKKLRLTYLLVCDVLNRAPNKAQPWVGDSAFYTEAGMHQSGLERDHANYWHANPAQVGNQARIGLTDQSGKSNITAKAREFNIKLTEEELASIAVRYQKLINNGANFGQADASFYLFLMRELGRLPKFFDVHALNVMIEKIKGFAITSTANLHLKINGKAKINKTCGVGPVHAMDAALRLSLKDKLPSIKQVRLIDFKVRDVESHHGSAAKVRVVISFSDKQLHWSTMAVHQNIIIASWKALLDGYIYKMSRATSPTLLPSPLIH